MVDEPKLETEESESDVREQFARTLERLVNTRSSRTGAFRPQKLAPPFEAD